MGPGSDVLDEVTWDLNDLLGSEKGGAKPRESVERLMDESARLAEAFESRYSGKVGDLDGPGLRTAMEELAAISDLIGRALSFAHLAFAADTSDEEAGALMQAVTERATGVQTRLVFFELEWVAIPDDRAEDLLATDGMDFCRHHLRLERRYRPHLLSQPEERLATELSVTGAGAWSRLFEELTSAIEVEVPDEPSPEPLDSALSRLAHPEREVRRGVAEAITAALSPGLKTRAFIYNTLLQDKSIKDRIRSYPNWVRARNLSNEASDESVQALVSAVEARREIPQRWYRTKARLLGVEKLADYDRMASLVADDQRIEWTRGREIVLDAFAELGTEPRERVERFFAERWIDAPPRPSKRGGAFSAGTVPSVHPYVMLNYTGRRRDVLTLAHELGHGLHQSLAASQGIFHQDTPLTVAETASVFAEQLVFGRLIDRSEDAGSKLALLAEAIEGQIATVFRQVAMFRFEDRAHTARRESGEISLEHFGDLWTQTQGEMLGDSVELTPGYRDWWSYVPHFIATPGYVYAYAYGQLLALSVYELFRERGREMVPGYLEMLRSGGSSSPEDLGKLVGMDLADPGFWDRGLDLVERQLGEAEAAAGKVLAERG